MKEWKYKKLKKMYYKYLKAGFINYSEYWRKIRELNREFKHANSQNS